jgi:threonine aldolase
MSRPPALDGPVGRRDSDMVMQFQSDNAASVHPNVWSALLAADTPDAPYDGDALSARLDEAFSEVFERPCWALWVASGTAANCLALATMVPPQGAAICHREAHIETSEGGAPGFYTHGAKLLLTEGDGAKLTPQAIAGVIDAVSPGVHWVQPAAVSITQATELGCVYTPEEVTAIGLLARERVQWLHMDGARFANAVAALRCSPAAVSCDAGVHALSFGCVKNGGMGAEAIVFFDEGLADIARYRRKRAGHLLSKGRFMAAQILALLDGKLWLENALAANEAAALIARGAAGRLIEPAETNQLFVRLTAQERARLRAQGFVFYDHGAEGARFVTAWDSKPADCAALGVAIAAL